MPVSTTPSLFAALSRSDRPANVLAAARALAVSLARSRALDRRLVADVMTTAFGASDAEGAWTWRDAYDAIEAGTVLQIRRLAPQVARLEDAPAEIAALLAGVSGLGLTHSRRSEEQVVLDQFSTPPPLAAMTVLAAQVRAGDRVLEPSAGTGLLAVVAEVCGGALSLNELAPGRAALLDGLFPQATRTRHDGRHLADPFSLMAIPAPKTTTATTAAAWTTGPVIDWTTCCKGPSQGIPDPPARAGPAKVRPHVIAAPNRRRPSVRCMFAFLFFSAVQHAATHCKQNLPQVVNNKSQ